MRAAPEERPAGARWTFNPASMFNIDVDARRASPRRAGRAVARLTTAALVAGAALASPAAAGAQAAGGSDSLDSLVAWAVATSPMVRTAAARAEAARQRIAPAGSRPDPMLMLGVQNFPLSEPGFGDFMTMKMIGAAQTIPFPGKRALRTRVAERERDAAAAALAGAKLDVASAVRSAYYDLVQLDRTLEIVERNQRLLVDVGRVTEARYGAGTSEQVAVLRIRVEAARLAEEAVAVVERRRAALAQLNAALDRPSDAPVRDPSIPPRIVRAAVADSAAAIRFVSSSLGARAADSPVPSLDVLQAMALRNDPGLRAHESLIAAQLARAELARKEHLPDFDLSLAYGQRDGLSDMVTAAVSVPIPIQRGRRQNAAVAETRAELAAMEAERLQRRNALRAEVARVHGELERTRAQLALYVKAILPQGRAALTSAVSGYRASRSDFLSLLDAQGTLFAYESTYFRLVSDFAISLAELERLVGEELVR